MGNFTQNFIIFSFNPFTTLVQNFKSTPSASPKLLNLNQEYPSKNLFWSNTYKIEVMKMLEKMEMLELPNFGHMPTCRI